MSQPIPSQRADLADPKQHRDNKCPQALEFFTVNPKKL
jgi:hypothetical protein